MKRTSHLIAELQTILDTYGDLPISGYLSDDRRHPHAVEVLDEKGFPVESNHGTPAAVWLTA